MKDLQRAFSKKSMREAHSKVDGAFKKAFSEKNMKEVGNKVVDAAKAVEGAFKKSFNKDTLKKIQKSLRKFTVALAKQLRETFEKPKTRHTVSTNVPETEQVVTPYYPDQMLGASVEYTDTLTVWNERAEVGTTGGTSDDEAVINNTDNAVGIFANCSEDEEDYSAAKSMTK